jgi:hypothetical protein
MATYKNAGDLVPGDVCTERPYQGLAVMTDTRIVTTTYRYKSPTGEPSHCRGQADQFPEV